jgi:hypothetical protein
MILSRALRSFSFALPGVVQGTTYKPKAPVEFDGKGDALIYSCEPMDGASIFLPMPYSIGTLSIPLMGMAWYGDMLGLGLGNFMWLGAMYAAAMPHCWHLYNLRFRVDKIWYVRGGHWKFQTSGVNQMTSYTYSEPKNLTHVEGQLTSDGNLLSDVKLSADTWIDFQEMLRD